MASSDSEEYLSAEEEDGTDIRGEHTPENEQTVRCKELINDGACSSNMSKLSDNLSDMRVHEPSDQAEHQSSAEFVSNLDNKYVSEGTDDVKDEMVELTEEQIKEMKEQANKLKASGNEAFKGDSIEKAVKFYSDAINLYPKGCTEELAICYANRAACNIKIERHDDVVQDCTKALELRPDYLKALMRRAQSNEALEKLEDALEDYKKALELDPSQTIARHAVARLPHQIKEQQEKMKEEMIGKLKELGDAVLKPFGLSTNNFQLQQDPNSGGYSINFNR